MSRLQFWVTNYLTIGCLLLATGIALWIGHGLWGFADTQDICANHSCNSVNTVYTPASIYFKVVFCAATAFVWSIVILGIVWLWYEENLKPYLRRDQNG